MWLFQAQLPHRFRCLLHTQFLTDSNPPLNETVQYSTRQTIAEVTSPVSSLLNVTFDNTSPTATVNQAASQTDPATSLPIRFTAVFSEPISGLDRQTISLAGSTADITNAFVSVNTINATNFTIEVSGVRSPGQVVVTLPARAAYDPVINYSEASTSTDNSVNFQPNTVNVAVSGRVRKTSGVTNTPSTVTLTDNLTGEIWTARTTRVVITFSPD